MARKLDRILTVLALGSVLGIGVLQGQAMAPQVPADEEDPAAPEVRLRGLLLECRDRWQRVLEGERIKLQVGKSTPVQEDWVRKRLRNVELELARDRAERIGVLERALKDAVAQEEGVRRRIDVGTAAKSYGIHAEAARLEVTIQLEEEKRAGKAPTPEQTDRLRSLREAYVTRKKDLLRAEQVKMQVGRSIPYLVHHATCGLLDAQLEVEESAAGRIRVAEQIVKEVSAQEEETRRRLELGTAGEIDALFGKAARLEVQIRLELEKLRGNELTESDLVRLKELREQRVGALTKVLAAERKMLSAGRSIPSIVGRLEIDVLEARLDLAEGRDQRISVLERMVEIAFQLERDLRAQCEIGAAAPFDVTRAEADRLELQVRLERERMREDP